MAIPIAQKKVLILCGDYMEDTEVMVHFQALQAYGVIVDAVCPGRKSGDFCRTAIQFFAGHQTYAELRGHNFRLTATFEEIINEASELYDGLIIQGGRAPEYLAMDKSVLDLVNQFSTSGKPITAMCHGQIVVTGSSRFDGNLITGVSYAGNSEYISLFVKALGGIVTCSDDRKRILFLCGDFMENYEITVPFQSLQALGCHVDSVCPNKEPGDKCTTAIHDFEGDQTYSEKPGHDFVITAKFEGIDSASYDALVIPGGRAPEYLALDENVIKLVKEFMETNKPVASIGHGLQILAAADVLNGRKCTAYPSVKINVELAEATWLEPDPMHSCFTDGNLVTGAAWSGHPEFIFQLMAVLLGISVSF